MIIVPGRAGKDLCDPQLGVTRRDILRVGGSGLLGLGLGSMLELQAVSARRRRKPSRGPGWGKAKSIIMVYLQGGPSHLDLWDPKENVPDNVRSVFKPIATKVPGIQVTEILPKLAADHRQVHVHPVDELHAQRPLQPHGGHLPDDDRLHDRQGQPVRPARAAQPQGLPQLRLADHPAQAADRADAAVRDAAAAACRRANVVGKGGTAGFLGKAFDPYTLYPDGDDMDMAKMDRIKVDDLQLRPEVFAMRLAAPGQAPRRDRTPACRRSTRPSPTTTSTNTTTGP